MSLSYPLVTICCITYNHEKFIQEALDGFLMQKTNFSIEIIIHDDASTDNTANIIREYQAQYPHLIKPVFQTENQYSSVGFGFISSIFQQAQGKYIALCEGDDYWTDPLKLQKQIDFLEANPDFAICFHQAQVLEQGELKNNYINRAPAAISTIIDLARGNYIMTASCVFRNNTSNILGPNFLKSPCGDYYIHIMNAQYGHIFYMDEIMSVYRIHENSIFAGQGLFNAYQKILKSMICMLLDLTHPSPQVGQELRFSIINLAMRIYAFYIYNDKDQAAYNFGSFLDSCCELDAPQESLKMRHLFQEVFRNYFVDTLQENLHLRATNYIIFPDLSQGEASIYQDLVNVITSLEEHPDCENITLLINASKFPSHLTQSFTDNLCQEEEEGLQISLVGQLSPMQWQVLLPRLTARMILTHEDQETIAQVFIEDVPTVTEILIPSN
jgi:glycosyltransferase involved in cell wall biosynthesis